MNARHSSLKYSGTQRSLRVPGLGLWPEAFIVSFLPIMYTIQGYRPIKYTAHFVVFLVCLSVFWRWVLDPLKIPAYRLSENFKTSNLAALFATACFGVWSVLGFLQGAANGFANPLTWWIDAINILAAVYLFSLLGCAGRLVDRGFSHWQVTVVVGLIFYFSANIILWLFGVQSAGGMYAMMGENRILALIGVNVLRVTFPVSSGLNGMAIFATASIGIGLAFLFTQSGFLLRSLALVLIGICAFVILMSDSRGALFAMMIVLAAAVFVRRAAFRRILPWLLTLLPLLPLMAIAFVSLIPKDIIFGLLSRGGGQFVTPAAALTTGRNYIWGSILSLFEEPSFNIVYGWGMYGHVASGASTKFAWIFDDSGITAHTTHNMYLQAFVDRGIIGLIILVTTIFIVIKSLMRRYVECQSSGTRVTEPLMGILILTALTAGGGSEAVLSLYFPDHLWMFFLACALAYAARADTPVVSKAKDLAGRGFMALSPRVRSES